LLCLLLLLGPALRILFWGWRSEGESCSNEVTFIAYCRHHQPSEIEKEKGRTVGISRIITNDDTAFDNIGKGQACFHHFGCSEFEAPNARLRSHFPNAIEPPL
jgi:hypothetical protein